MTARSGETTPLLDELAVAAARRRAARAAEPGGRRGVPRRPDGRAARAGARRGRRARDRRRPVPARGARPRRARVPAPTWSGSARARSPPPCSCGSGRLPPAAMAVAYAATILDGHAELRHVAALAGVADAEPAVEALVDAGFLKPGRPLTFAQTMVRTCLHEQLTEAERSHLHARAAGAAARRGPAPGGARTAPAGHRAGRRRARWCGSCAPRPRTRCARARPRPRASTCCRALREPPAADALAGVLGALGEAEWCRGRGLRGGDGASARGARPHGGPGGAPGARAARCTRRCSSRAGSSRPTSCSTARSTRATGVADPEDVWRMEAALTLDRAAQPRDRRPRERPPAAVRGARRRHARRGAAARERRVLEVGGGDRGRDGRARPSRADERAGAGGRRARLDPDLRGAVGALLRRRARAGALRARRHARRRAGPRLGVRHLHLVRAARPDRVAARRRDRRRAGGADRGRAAGPVGLRAPARCSARSRWRSWPAATSTAPRPRSRRAAAGRRCRSSCA